MVNFLEAGQGFGLRAIQDLLLVHVHYIEVELVFWEAPMTVRLSCHFEEEPVAVAFGVCVRLEVQVELALLNLDCQVQIPTLKHRVECQFASF